MKNIFLFIGMLALATACNQSSSAQSVEANEFKAKLESSENKILLDVRTPQEFNVSHIEGAININIYDRNFEGQIQELDKNKTVFVYCKSGGRSGEATKTLQKNGFEVYDLNGGLLKWQSNGLEVERGKTKPPVPTYSLDQYSELIDTSGLVLVDFMAEWCGPCKQMAPSIAELKKEYAEGLTVLKIDVDKNQSLSQYFQINSIPLVKVYNDGKLVHDQVGYHSKEQLLEVLKPYL